jgi:hypothetical protein
MARLKRRSKNTRRTYRCSHHHEASYPRRSKLLQQTTDATLTTTEKESAWSCEVCMHDMAIMMRCNLSKLSGIRIPTHIYGSSCFTTPQIIYFISMAKQGMNELHKIKWNRDKYITIPHIPYLIIKWFLFTPKMICNVAWMSLHTKYNYLKT